MGKIWEVEAGTVLQELNRIFPNLLQMFSMNTFLSFK